MDATILIEIKVLNYILLQYIFVYINYVSIQFNALKNIDIGCDAFYHDLFSSARVCKLFKSVWRWHVWSLNQFRYFSN